MTNDLIRHLSGLFQCGSCRQDGLGQQRSLVFIGEVGGGHAEVQDSHEGNDHQEDDQISPFSSEGVADQTHIETPQTKEAVVEPPEKRAQESDGIFRLMPGRYRLEQSGAEDRRQDQRHEHRQEHGGDDGYGELAVDDAGGAGEECHGTEHGR